MRGTLHTSQYIVQFLLKYLIDLGLEFLNSNKSVEMSQILDNVQRLYVPMTNVDSEQKILENVLFDGDQLDDQLTEERSRNAQSANAVADTEIDRLEGLEPTFGDSQLKKNLYQVVLQTSFAWNDDKEL